MDVLENVAEPAGKQNPQGIRSQNVYTQTTAKNECLLLQAASPEQIDCGTGDWICVANGSRPNRCVISKAIYI